MKKIRQWKYWIRISIKQHQLYQYMNFIRQLRQISYKMLNNELICKQLTQIKITKNIARREFHHLEKQQNNRLWSISYDYEYYIYKVQLI
ncbi:unnamed protein product [Paramecium pentaurelia]|uniref:Uncharacterized protein n=1 Tax=Paramecium pentaurelia TaxID=43138 RepID=A0A8S1TRA7_9CILI|nr:unnamed protein product [Paramecium pentaurelia]